MRSHLVERRGRRKVLVEVELAVMVGRALQSVELVQRI